MRRIVLVTVTLSWLLAFDPGVAFAGDAASHGRVATRCKTKDKRKIERSLRKAKGQYALRKINAALLTLQDGIRHGKRTGCTGTITVARALLQEAIIHYVGSKRSNVALERMQEALASDHSVLLPPNQPPGVTNLWKQANTLHDAMYHAAKGDKAGKAGKARKAVARPARVRTSPVAGHRNEALTIGFQRVRQGGASPALRLRLRRTRRLTKAGDLLLKKGKLTAAYKKYRQALRLAPNSLEVRERLGVVQFRLGDFSGALRTVEWIRKHAGEARADRLRSLQSKSTR